MSQYQSHQEINFSPDERGPTNSFRLPPVLDLMAFFDTHQGIYQPIPDILLQLLRDHGPPGTVNPRDITIGPTIDDLPRDDEPAPFWETRNIAVPNASPDGILGSGSSDAASSTAGSSDNTTPAPNGDASPAKRKRGRPKGVKNKPKYDENGNVIVREKKPKANKRKREPEPESEEDGDSIVVGGKRRSPGAKTKPTPLTPPSTLRPSSPAPTPAAPQLPLSPPY